MTDDATAAGFSGLAHLLPLPNLVFFPGVVQGLHIFEPRYRQMMADAVESDGLITLVMLRPDWEEGYEAKPDIEEVACLGRIVWHEQLADGRYNLRLRGMSRVRILEVVPTDRLYRTARVEVIAETAPAELPELTALRHALADVLLPRFAEDAQAQRQLSDLFGGELPLGRVCDIIAYALPLPVQFKQSMLAEPDAGRRAVALAEAFRPPPNRKFPPSFSEN